MVVAAIGPPKRTLSFSLTIFHVSCIVSVFPVQDAVAMPDMSPCHNFHLASIVVPTRVRHLISVNQTLFLRKLWLQLLERLQTETRFVVIEVPLQSVFNSFRHFRNLICLHLLVSCKLLLVFLVQENKAFRCLFKRLRRFN